MTEIQNIIGSGLAGSVLIGVVIYLTRKLFLFFRDIKEIKNLKLEVKKLSDEVYVDAENIYLSVKNSSDQEIQKEKIEELINRMESQLKIINKLKNPPDSTGLEKSIIKLKPLIIDYDNGIDEDIKASKNINNGGLNE